MIERNIENNSFAECANWNRKNNSFADVPHIKFLGVFEFLIYFYWLLSRKSYLFPNCYTSHRRGHFLDTNTYKKKAFIRFLELL